MLLNRFLKFVGLVQHFSFFGELHEDIESFNLSLPWRHNFGCTSFKLTWLREGTD